MIITNHHNLPDYIVRAVSYDDYDYEEAGDISASGLVLPARIRQLLKRHDHEITVDASELIWKLVGSIGHKIVERAADPNTLVEERLKASVLGWWVTGKFDVLYEKNGYGIDDVKFTSTYAMKYEKKEWTAQTNIYTWLAKQHSFDIKRLRITAVLRDWSKPKAARSDGDYPPVGVVVREVPLWSEGLQEQYIKSRVIAHQHAEQLYDERLPPCTDEERWAKPDTWAVKKKGKPRALRVLPSWDEAERFLNDRVSHDFSFRGEIEHRPGNKTVRCSAYCLAAPFCNQYRALKSLVPAENEKWTLAEQLREGPNER